MEPSAASMPDVRPMPCDHSEAALPAGHHLHPEAPFVGPLPNSSCPKCSCSACEAVACSGIQRLPSRYPMMPGFRGDGLLPNLGLRYCSSSSVYTLRPSIGGISPQASLSEVSSRLCHSMENLHWAGVSDRSLFGSTCRSMDSEFIFHCSSSSHWANGAHDVLYPYRVPLKQDLPFFPQWLFPSLDERARKETSTKGVKEKFRFQSARITEPNKPLRALMGRCDPGTPEKDAPPPQPMSRITSPEDIKQEALRRLRLRRQRSSPNLSLLPLGSPAEMAKSHTGDALSTRGCPALVNPSEGPPERRRAPVGRLHIPTFEEFKRMRQKKSSQPEDGQVQAGGGQGQCRDGSVLDNQVNEKGEGVDGQGHAGNGQGQDLVGVGLQRDETNNRQSTAEVEGAQRTDRNSAEISNIKDTSQQPCCHGNSWGLGSEPAHAITHAESKDHIPICSGPMPRSPLQPTAREAQTQAPTHSTNTDTAQLIPLPRCGSLETPPTCCASLLLDSADLSSYGAKISKIKDGFIGSAIDLIKKSCSADASAEGPAWRSRDRDGSRPGCQSDAVSMTTAGRRTEQHSSPGCRRSSSDAAYETTESARAQRERRLRPHFSDPMPADATKRKQLEMKIAAAARHPATHRDIDRDSKSEQMGLLGAARVGQQRWSKVSSLSADSGVVGLGDDREEDEEARGAQPATDAEQVDRSVGPAPAWERPTEALEAWEVRRPCSDCGQQSVVRADGLCERCSKQRMERKEAILELLNTEASYGEDLRIIKEEFYCPMQGAGLLSAEQLAVVFGNVQELIDVNEKFTEQLQESIDRAFEQGDEDLLTVCIGEIFLEFVSMLPAFQTYCLQQSTSVNMLNTLEKEKELLRIFLDVSQNDNTALRRMNLRSFLMAPLQRVTKYPLLLSRISKATTERHPDHASLREAKSHVESHLEHINMKTKQESASWSLRSFRRDGRKNREAVNLEMREASMRTVGWTRESTRFVMEGPLQLAQPADGQWVRKGSRALKFQNVQSLLMVHTQRTGDGNAPDGGDSLELVRDGVLVLIKDKSSGKFTVLREPIRLSNCVVSSDPDCEDTFELLDIPREAYVLRATDKSRTQQWFRQIKRYSRDLGPWRKRRNALPNIMINTAQNRS